MPLCPFFLERRGALRVAVGALSICALLSACTTPEPKQPSEARTNLRIGAPEGKFGEDIDGVQQVSRILRLEGLTTLAPDGRAQGQLAESWTWDQDGLALRIRLRPNIQLHNGETLTAAAVAATLKQAIERPSNRALYWTLSDVRDVTSPTEGEILLTLARRTGALPEDLDLPLAFGKNGDGTGPYRIRTPGDEVVLERFDRYYRGRPQIQEVVVRPYSTLRTAWTSLLRGEIDMVTNVPPDAVAFVGNESILVTSFPRRYQYLVAFNSKQKPFDAPVVRRALNLAVNRQEVVADTLGGRAIPATGPFWPLHWAYDTSIPPYEFDPRAAEGLLDRANLPRRQDDGQGREGVRFKFTCLIPANFRIDERLGLRVQKQLYDVGVDLQFEALPADEYSRRITSGQFEAVLIDLISGPSFGRPYIFWRAANGVPGFNVFGYSNPEVERLFQVLRESTNEGVIRSAARRLQIAMAEDPPALFLAWSQRTRAISREFEVSDDGDRDPLHSLWRWNSADSVARSQ